MENVTATVTNAVTTEATCKADGVRTYTAKVTFEGKDYTDTKTETLPATGHAYGEPVWAGTMISPLLPPLPAAMMLPMWRR